MATNANLGPGQYQLGDLIFGRGTRYKVESVEIQPYEVNPQDFQVSQSDEIRFGRDTFKPASIMFTMSVLLNRALPNVGKYAGSPNLDFSNELNLVPELQREWRADDIRSNWGQLKPLRWCDRDGNVRRIYGRPRKFQYSKVSANSDFVKVVAEFKCSDTLSYDDTEMYVELEPDAAPVMLTRQKGNASSWLRLLLLGPIDHPVITVGTQQIELNYDLVAGELVEISSYPWQRRAINDGGYNLSPLLIGETQYLDRLKLPEAGVPCPVRWTAESMNTWVPTIQNQTWSDSMDDLSYRNISSEFSMITGQIYIFWRFYTSKFIGGRGPRGAGLYNKKQFNSATQYAEVRIASLHTGRTGLVIMSNDTMTDFACLEIENGASTKSLKICSGSSPSTIVTQATYSPPGFNWSLYDRAAIGYDPDTKIYTAYLNGNAVTTWHDTFPEVATGSNNRHQGIIVSMDNIGAYPGCGVDNLVAYDNDQSGITYEGSVVLLWRDAYQGFA